MNSIVVAFVFSLNVYFIAGDRSGQLFLKGVAPPDPPVPTPDVNQCLEEIVDQINECRSEAIAHWNISSKSTQRDICCADWQYIDCDLSAAQSKCSSEEYDETKQYADEVIAYITQTSCSQYPKGSAECTVPFLSEALFGERPPLPGPTVVDCLTQFSRKVVRACAIEARIKWNVTRHDRNARDLCCAAWDDIDCIDQVVKIRCPSQEVQDTEKYFAQLESWAADRGCKSYAYHSQNCTQKEVRDDPSESMPYIPLNLPNPRREYADDSGVRRTDSTYFYFVLNYMLTAFPHLLHMMIILAIILITIVVIQCVIIARQVKHDRMFAQIMPHFQGYRKV